ncbi:MAG: hypothetical protein E7513_05615 [Ruminococcaceae bacterium]|nr:hypothetical protein [Oscillospiraceae bacterium]
MKRFTLKIVALILCFSLCFTLSSCAIVDEISKSIFALVMPKGIAEDVSLGYTHIENTAFLYSEHYTAYKSTDSYSCLENDKMRELYRMLLENVYYVYPQANVDGEYKTKQVILEEAQLSQAQIRLTIKALTDDNPQVFWLSTTFGYLISEDQNYTAVQLYSRVSPKEVQQQASELKAKVDDFYKNLEKSLTPYQLELYIHDYILDNCVYDDSIGLDDVITVEKAKSFDAYGALVEGVAVCEGYSRAFQLLCHGVGIRCINLIGESQNELHMWSCVVLDGDWYYVDTTWDDNLDKAFRYDYFNINEEQLRVDHEFSKLWSQMSEEEICGDSDDNALTSNFFIPKSTNTAYNYYVRNSAHLIDYEAEKVIDSLLTSATKKEEYFHFYIDPKEFSYDNAVDQLFYSYPQYFFSYIDKVNASLADYSLEKEDLSLYKKKTLSVVTVVLKYV